MRLSIYLFFILVSTVVYSQPSDSAQLKAQQYEQLLPSLTDEEKIKTLQWLGEHYTFLDTEKAIHFYRMAIAEGTAINYKDLSYLHGYQIYSFIRSGQLDSADAHFQIALKITPKDSPALALIYNNGGTVYLQSGRYATALDYYLKAQATAEQTVNERQLMRSYANVALVYAKFKNFKKAMKYDSLGYTYALKNNETLTAIIVLSNLGEHLQQTSSYNKAMKVFLKAEQLSLSSNAFDFPRALIYANMAENKLQTKRGDSAVYYGLKSLDIFKKQNAELHMGAIHEILTRGELMQGNIKNAEQYATISYNLGTQNKEPKEVRDAVYHLMKIKLKQNNDAQAAIYEQQFLGLTDSLERENQAKAVIELQTKYDTEKKEKENELLKRDQELQKIQLARTKQITVYMAVVLLLVVIMLVLAYRSYRNKQKANAELRQQRESIKEQNILLQKTLMQLNAAQSQLIHAEKMASLGTMTAGIAHEINNPLSFVQAGAQNLSYCFQSLTQLLSAYEAVELNPTPETTDNLMQVKKKIKPSDLREEIEAMLKAIETGTTRTTKIIAGLQKFSHKTSEKIISKNLQHLIEDTLILVWVESKNRVKIDCTYQREIMLACRPAELGQVLLNLLLNALHAIEGEGTIFITTVSTPQHAIITIRDTGKGIAKENLSKIFDPFFTTKEVGKGTGLGLSITHGIIKNHGGEITVQSEVGIGTEFTITLPLQWAGTKN